MSEIVLFGATGFTGTLVAERLHELGLPFAIAGRNRARLQQLSERVGNAPIRVADAARPRSLHALTEGSRVLINCAGPFARYGEPVVSAAVESGVHYVDTTGEQAWMKRILNRYDGVALRNKTTIINALAYEYAVGDWLAALATRQIGRSQMLDSISVGYTSMGSDVSPGTALSALEILGEYGWSYEGGRWLRRPPGWTKREMQLPMGTRTLLWVPLGEVLMVPRHERVQTVLTYMRFSEKLTALLPLVGRAGPTLRPLLRPLVARYMARQPVGPAPDAQQRTRFAVTVEAQRGGEVVSLIGSGVDAYGITAKIVVLGAELLLTEAVPRGVRAPAHLPLRPDEALQRVGVTVTDA